MLMWRNKNCDSLTAPSTHTHTHILALKNKKSAFLEAEAMNCSGMTGDNWCQIENESTDPNLCSRLLQ